MTDRVPKDTLQVDTDSSQGGSVEDHDEIGKSLPEQ